LVERLAEAILRTTADTEMMQRARLMGEEIRAEDDVKQAVDAIHNHARV